MAQLKVIRKFRDKTNEARVFGAGEIITVADPARVENILSLGLAELVADDRTEQEMNRPKRNNRKKKADND